VDTSVLTLEFASGALGVLMNTRRTVYGYDLRVEVHGEHGKLVTEDERVTKVWRYDKDGIHGDYYYFFLERFKEAYRLELQAFVDAVREGRQPSPDTEDAIESLRVADAATLSLKEGRPVEVKEVQA
jgi:myo-inositol 2-dehydrogenase/D-chiro-inositol 1-dehydrogenase